MRRRATGAVLLLALLGACGKRAPVAKPTAQEAWAAAKLPPLPRGPVVPARRTNVLPVPPRQGPPDDPVLVALGKKIFFDERLSEPPGTSCASCHDPARAFSGRHGSALGVPLGSRPAHFARRSTPSVLYMRYVPKFHYFEDDEAPAPEPRGGFFWDGRSDSVAELVQQPLFNPNEMNAGTPRRLAAKVVRGPYAREFRGALGAASDDKGVMRGIGVALEAFLTSDEMTPQSSKYDAYVRGEATLTAQEKLGLEVFKDRRRGACSGCHRMAETSTNAAESMFTDYGYDAIAVPRNRELPASRAAASFDLGLCERRDTKVPSIDAKWCSSFRTPSLRNVAVRESFGHNGVFKSLRDVVTFYSRRAVAPDLVYPKGQKFDDVPGKYRANVNIYAPIYNRREGAPPPMSDAEIDAVVAFLGTLTDAPFVPSSGRTALAQLPTPAR
ncbi:MAG TPA: cytochrome c peroxidase [Polyangia bacterium]|nr:cytochrome c peroxidase [Polyangia bacterium]